jgi:hypothetical protein
VLTPRTGARWIGIAVSPAAPPAASLAGQAFVHPRHRRHRFSDLAVCGRNVTWQNSLRGGNSSSSYGGSWNGHQGFICRARPEGSSSPGARGDIGFDVEAVRDGRPLLVEIKAPTPQTSARLEAMLDQLRAAADRYQAMGGRGTRPQLLAVVPGLISPTKHTGGCTLRSAGAQAQGGGGCGQHLWADLPGTQRGAVC